jgi:hypothetical protein
MLGAGRLSALICVKVAGSFAQANADACKGLVPEPAYLGVPPFERRVDGIPER